MPKKSTSKSILSGPKFNGRHTTFNELAGEVLAVLKPLGPVKKIVLGPIKQLRPGDRRLSVREDAGQVRIQCRDVGSVQLLWVIGMDEKAVKMHVKHLVRRR